MAPTGDASALLQLHLWGMLWGIKLTTIYRHCTVSFSSLCSQKDLRLHIRQLIKGIRHESTYVRQMALTKLKHQLHCNQPDLHKLIMAHETADPCISELVHVVRDGNYFSADLFNLSDFGKYHREIICMQGTLQYEDYVILVLDNIKIRQFYNPLIFIPIHRKRFLTHWGRVTHICVRNKPSLRLYGAKPLYEPMLEYC